MWPAVLGGVSSISDSLFWSCSAGGDLTDDEWAVLEPLLPKSNNRCGRWRDHRQVINGIVHRLSTGCQWRKLPERFGPWEIVHKRHIVRNTVERAVNKLKQFRAVATRYDKRGYVYLGTVTAAALLIWLRS
ncbi:transposase [Streptomyces asiaticus]